MPTVSISVAAVLIGTSETTVGTVPVGAEWNIATIRFCNTDSVDHNLTVYRYNTSGESAGAATTEYQELLIQAKSTFEYAPAMLAAGHRISALADTASMINARIHGWQVGP